MIGGGGAASLQRIELFHVARDSIRRMKIMLLTYTVTLNMMMMMMMMVTAGGSAAETLTVRSRC